MPSKFKKLRKKTGVWFVIYYDGKERFSCQCAKTGLREYRRLRKLMRYKKKLSLHKVSVKTEQIIVP